MEKLRRIFNGVEDPREQRDAHDFHEMDGRGASSLCGGQTCVDMADFAKPRSFCAIRVWSMARRATGSRGCSGFPVPFAADLARFAAVWAKGGGRPQIAIAARRSGAPFEGVGAFAAIW